VLYAIPEISGKMQRTLRGLRGNNVLTGRSQRRAWRDSERDYCGCNSLLRRNLEAVSGWGVKGLLWQQMERQAARR